MSIPVVIDGQTVQLSPVGAAALRAALLHEQNPHRYCVSDPRAACRDRLVRLGLATVHRHGHIELTDLGRTVAGGLA